MKLAESGFYNGTLSPCDSKLYDWFGCPESKAHTASRWNRWSGYAIPDEHAARLSNKVEFSMANSGPNSGGSQFFINTKHNAYLDWFDGRTPSAHPVFGKITDGMRVVSTLAVCLVIVATAE